MIGILRRFMALYCLFDLVFIYSMCSSSRASNRHETNPLLSKEHVVIAEHLLQIRMLSLASAPWGPSNEPRGCASGVAAWSLDLAPLVRDDDRLWTSESELR